MSTNHKQKPLPFDNDKERDRLARVERLLGREPRIKTAARYFTEEEYQRATRRALETVQKDTSGRVEM